MLKTRDDYINSIRELNPVIYLNGERVESCLLYTSDAADE